MNLATYLAADRHYYLDVKYHQDLDLNWATIDLVVSCQNVSAKLMLETKRLQLLIPSDLQAAIKIERSRDLPSYGRNRRSRKVLKTRRLERDRYAIEIDLAHWQSLAVDLRNLLFWHEIAKIENGAMLSNRSTYLTLLSAASISSIDLATQNITMLVSALSIAGLAVFRLYQNHWGEQHLRKLTTADRDAIELAVEFGYDRDTARELLKSALSQTRFSADRSTRSLARLQVLSLVSGGEY